MVTLAASMTAAALNVLTSAIRFPETVSGVVICGGPSHLLLINLLVPLAGPLVPSFHCTCDRAFNKQDYSSGGYQDINIQRTLTVPLFLGSQRQDKCPQNIRTGVSLIRSAAYKSND